MWVGNSRSQNRISVFGHVNRRNTDPKNMILMILFFQKIDTIKEMMIEKFFWKGGLSEKTWLKNESSHWQICFFTWGCDWMFGTSERQNILKNKKRDFFRKDKSFFA